MQIDERRIAVFIDFENVAMGVRESRSGNFDIDLVLKRLVEKGKIMVKRGPLLRLASLYRVQEGLSSGCH